MRLGWAVTLPFLLAACAPIPADEDDARAPRTPAQAACADAVKTMEGRCDPNLLRAGTQNPECSWETRRVVGTCGQPR
ncbi:MAG TPA: hypothetical protein VFA75_18790 [Nevskia sp.]|nr:hypothetical protein [Nevskia sp.]